VIASSATFPDPTPDFVVLDVITDVTITTWITPVPAW
jgi:hypothetical protein